MAFVDTVITLPPSDGLWHRATLSPSLFESARTVGAAGFGTSLVHYQARREAAARVPRRVRRAWVVAALRFDIDWLLRKWRHRDERDGRDHTTTPP